jgi:outer membrane lipoprotein-sorting protein
VLELARDYVSEGPGTAVIEARASQYSDQGGLKGKLLLIARRPGHLRMEGLSPTDDSVSVLATDGERFTSYQRGANHCFVGRACPDNVGRFVSVPLAADDLVGVLLGRPPIIPHDSATMKWDGEVGAYRLELVGSSAGLGAAHGKIQRLWVRHGDGRIVRTTLSVGGKTKVNVIYSEFKRVGEHWMPTRLDVALSRDSTDLRLEYRDIDPKAAIGDDAFSFECPAGTSLEELPCGSDAR